MLSLLLNSSLSVHNVDVIISRRAVRADRRADEILQEGVFDGASRRTVDILVLILTNFLLFDRLLTCIWITTEATIEVR